MKSGKVEGQKATRKVMFNLRIFDIYMKQGTSILHRTPDLMNIDRLVYVVFGKISASFMERWGFSLKQPHSYKQAPKKILCIIVLLLILSATCFALFGCAGETQKAYKPESPEQEAIRASLAAFEEAWNMHDESRLLHLLHDDFIVWEKGRRRILYSKSKFAFYLRDIMRHDRYLTLGRPTMWLKGDKATVHVPMSIDGRTTTSIFSLTKAGNKWFFLDWEQ